jgi:hypothetical protein
MPCPHKFLEDLNLDRLDFEPETLIVGTFNPAWPANNQAAWFYGRTARNYFWDVLPSIYGEPGLRNIPMHERPHSWKNFCSRNKVAITDLIRCINGANENEDELLLGNYRDDVIAANFHDFEFTDIIGLLQRFPSIKNVYLTTQANIPLFNDLWSTIEEYCHNHQQDYNCRRLLTPSGGARFQMQNYIPQNVVIQPMLANFIYESWLI